MRWEVLAAINEIETDYGRNLNVSSAGALGWMQFMPATWKAYGVDANGDGRKDPYNPVDAIFAAARYLKAAGADKDIRTRDLRLQPRRLVRRQRPHARAADRRPARRPRRLADRPDRGPLPRRTPRRATPTTLAEERRQARVAKGQNAAMPVELDDPPRVDRHLRQGRLARPSPSRTASIVQMGDDEAPRQVHQAARRLRQRLHVREPQEALASTTRCRSRSGRTAQGHARELDLPKPTRSRPPQRPPASRSRGNAAASVKAVAAKVTPAAASRARGRKERLFANPNRPRALKAGGEEQLLNAGSSIPGFTSYKSYFTEVFGLKRSDVVLKKLKVGLARHRRHDPRPPRRHVADRHAPHMVFEIRPAGKGAPRIDPKPILDGWKLLESTAIYRAAGKNPFFGPDAKTPSIGQILLMSKEALQRRVLADRGIKIYECGRRDIRAGAIDRRVLATLEFLAPSGLKPTVSALKCGHGYLTASGNVSEHSSGNAVDIAAINGIPILGHQGPGSITDITIRRLLTLQGTMKPHQIISLMTFEGADNTLALPDHDDHIHVGFQPLFDANRSSAASVNAVLKPGAVDQAHRPPRHDRQPRRC